MNSSETDEELFLRFRDDGDQAAFESIVLRYDNRMRNYVMKYVRDPEMARDTVQELFFRISRSSSTYEPKDRFSSWLYRIATNLAINAYKTQKAKGTYSLNEPLGCGWSTGKMDEDCELLDTLSDNTSTDAFEEIHVLDTAVQVRNAIRVLPLLQKAAFEAVVLRKQDYQQTALLQGCSVGTVKSRVHYARLAIKQALEKEVHNG